MMSQNRQAAKDRLAAALDYEVNLKAELAIAELHIKLDRLQASLEAGQGDAPAGDGAPGSGRTRGARAGRRLSGYPDEQPFRLLPRRGIEVAPSLAQRVPARPAAAVIYTPLQDEPPSVFGMQGAATDAGRSRSLLPRRRSTDRRSLGRCRPRRNACPWRGGGQRPPPRHHPCPTVSRRATGIQEKSIPGARTAPILIDILAREGARS